MQFTRQVFLPLAIVGITAAASIPPYGHAKSTGSNHHFTMNAWDDLCYGKAAALGQTYHVAKSLFVTDMITLHSKAANPSCLISHEGETKLLDASDDVRMEYIKRYMSFKTDASGKLIPDTD